MRNLLWHVLLLGGVLATTAACTDSSISSRDSITDTYLFYTTGSDPDYGIFAVDPFDPGNPVAVETQGAPPNARYPIYFLAGTVESGGTIADLHYRYLVYPSGTTLRKTSARRTDSLVKQRLSSENQANVICENGAGSVLTFDDYSDPEQSVMFYTKDPLDANACDSSGNEDMYMVRLGMTQSDAPLGPQSGFFPVSAVYDTSGAITGFLVLDQGAGNIELRDLNLANPTTLLSGVTTSAFPVAADTIGRTVLLVDNTNLHVFDPQTSTISATLHSQVTSLNAFPMPLDSSYFYYSDGDVIYRAPLDGSATSSVVVDESSGTGSLTGTLTLSRGKIVYQYDDTAGVNAEFVRSVSASGGTPSNIYVLPNNPSIRSFRVAAGRVYMSLNSPIRAAVSVGDDGSSPEVTPNAWWSGFTYNHRQPLFADFDLLGRSAFANGFVRMRPKVIFKVSYDLSGNTLTSFDSDTTAKLVDYGVPFSDFAVYNGGSVYPPVVHGLANNNRTLIFFDDVGGGGSTDVLFLHARNANSIVRVTNDTTDNQYWGMIGGCTIAKGSSFDPLFPILLVLSAIYLWRRKKAWQN
jgi:hypothetical protein